MRLERVTVWLIAVGCLTTVVEGQKSFWGSPQAYLGQTRPSDTPQIFAPDLLTEPGTIAMVTSRSRATDERSITTSVTDGAAWSTERSKPFGTMAIGGPVRRC